MNNKGTMELSVKIIVILIVALVLLGLILVFTREKVQTGQENLEQYEAPSTVFITPSISIISPIIGADEPYYASEMINFYGALTEDSGIENVDKYMWDFNGDGTIDSKSKEANYTYANSGTYTVKLRVANKDQTVFGEITKEISIIAGNFKNEEKYSNSPAFLVNQKGDWRSIYRMIPLAMWNSEGEINKFPLVVYYSSATTSTLITANLKEIMKDPNSDLDIADAVTFAYVDDTAVTNSNSTVAITRLNTANAEEYLSFWKAMQSVVVVDPDNKDDALMAALFAAYMNIPLLFLDTNPSSNPYLESRLGTLKEVYLIEGNVAVSQSVKNFFKDKKIHTTIYTSEDLRDTGINQFIDISATVS